MTTHTSRARAFALGEALMLIAAITITLAVLVAIGAKTSAGAGLNRDLGNLQQMGQWTASYTADFEDHAWGLTEIRSQWPALNPITGEDNIRRGAKQAIDIVRRRADRPNFPIAQNWLAHALYSHLALVDYVDLELPSRQLVATGDVHRMNWTDDPINKHDRGFWQPYQQPQGGGTPGLNDRRWPYSSSYTLGGAWFDEGQNDLDPSVPRVSQSSHNSYNLPSGVSIGPPRMSQVVFASSKVLLHDYGDWYRAKVARLHLVADAGTTVLLADGSADLRLTVDANPGWRPTFIASPDPLRYWYNPRDWEPPTSTGTPTELIEAARYRWTRGGVLGRDFGGDEIDTGQR